MINPTEMFLFIVSQRACLLTAIEVGHLKEGLLKRVGHKWVVPYEKGTLSRRIAHKSLHWLQTQKSLPLLNGWACLHRYCHVNKTLQRSTNLFPVPPSLYDCDFESGLCRWKQSTDDQFDWTRTRGPTSSTLTGPQVDHTTGTGM